MLVGDTAHLLSPANGVTEAELPKRMADWQKALGEASSKLNATGNDEKGERRP